MDDVPLMSDDRGVVSEEEEEGEGGEGEDGGSGGQGAWHGRRNWQTQIRSHSTLIGLVFGGGWQVALSK